MSFEEFHCGHLGYPNGTILAILNLYVAPMLPIKFRLNLTYGFEGDIIWTISRWPLWRPSWISERNNFSNSESLCHCDASHQVLAQSNNGLGGDVVWIISRWPPWISEQNNLSNSESLCSSYASHKVSAQSDLWVWRMKNFISFEEFQDGHGGHLGYWNGTILAILNLWQLSL